MMKNGQAGDGSHFFSSTSMEASMSRSTSMRADASRSKDGQWPDNMGAMLVHRSTFAKLVRVYSV